MGAQLYTLRTVQGDARLHYSSYYRRRVHSGTARPPGQNSIWVWSTLYSGVQCGCAEDGRYSYLSWYRIRNASPLPPLRWSRRTRAKKKKKKKKTHFHSVQRCYWPVPEGLPTTGKTPAPASGGVGALRALCRSHRGARWLPCSAGSLRVPACVGSKQSKTTGDSHSRNSDDKRATTGLRKHVAGQLAPRRASASQWPGWRISQISHCPSTMAFTGKSRAVSRHPLKTHHNHARARCSTGLVGLVNTWTSTRIGTAKKACTAGSQGFRSEHVLVL